MEKRKFEKLGIESSLLGFGCMRFPLDENGNIEEKEAEQMLEKLMFFLADIDTESKQGADTDNGMIELLDATRILTYYAEQAVGNLPSWSN